MPGYTIDLARGPRDAEHSVLERIGELRRDAAAGDSPLAAPPLWVVVPSRSLRLHLLGRLAASGAAEVCVGVRCVTVYGAALELAGDRRAGMPELLPVLAERFARDEPELAALARLRDGYAIVPGAVRDLLDAGFEPDLLAGMLEALEQPEARRAGAAAVARAAALLRVAAYVDRLCEVAELPARYRLYRRATDAVSAGRGPRLQGVVVHGFAEATGVVSELLKTLLRFYGGYLSLDRPRDPFVAGKLAGDGAFTQRLLERLRGATSTEVARDGESKPPAPRLLTASSPEIEIEEVAHRVLDLIAGGREPESIGVVMRDPTPYRLTLRRRFNALGIPFRTAGVEGAALPHRRRLSSLLALIDEVDRLPVDRWLEMLPPEADATASDLALALAKRGAARLAAAAAVSDESLRGELPVPLRGVRAVEADDATKADGVKEPGDAPPRLPQIPRAALRRTVERARRTLHHLERLRRSRTLSRHLVELRALVAEGLAWGSRDPARIELEERVLRPAAELPGDWQLEFEELRRLVSDLIAGAGRHDLGGSGGGVQVLDVMAARALTFDHLFLVGMQRGRFPRQVQEDPLLPDALRDVIAGHGAGALPDLPRKRTGRDEEAHLFAQLLAAAPEVTLSWAEFDADGVRSSPSPWIDRLRGTAGVATPAPERALSSWGEPTPGDSVERRRLARRPPDEWLRLAGLHGARRDVARLLPHAVAAVTGDSATSVGSVAGARLAILAERDPDLGDESGLKIWGRPGPFSGRVGAASKATAGSTARRIWVTRLEAMARCPWQYFLQHALELEPWPDPLADLPTLDHALVGRFVHELLQHMLVEAGAATGGGVAGAAVADPLRVAWPDPELLDTMLVRVARRVLAAEEIHLPGLTRGLVERARPMVELARFPLWQEGEPAVIGSELEGAVNVGEHSVDFRADLAIHEEAGIRFIDFKTGRPLSTARTPGTRHQHLLAAVARGASLQVAVYAASQSERPVAGGAYLYLNDAAAVDTGANFLPLDTADDEALASMRLAVERLLEARGLGVFPPRLTDPPPGSTATPQACDRCLVRQACLQGETAARRRQRHWVDGHQDPTRLDPDGERALATLWWMWDPKWPRPEAGEGS